MFIIKKPVFICTAMIVREEYVLITEQGTANIMMIKIPSM